MTADVIADDGAFAPGVFAHEPGILLDRQAVQEGLARLGHGVGDVFAQLSRPADVAGGGVEPFEGAGIAAPVLKQIVVHLHARAVQGLVGLRRMRDGLFDICPDGAVGSGLAGERVRLFPEQVTALAALPDSLLDDGPHRPWFAQRDHGGAAFPRGLRGAFDESVHQRVDARGLPRGLEIAISVECQHAGEREHAHGQQADGDIDYAPGITLQAEDPLRVNSSSVCKY